MMSSQDSDNGEMAAKKRKVDLPYRRKLKCADTDLTLVFGIGDGQTKIEVNSVILAGHSVYFDSLLSSTMIESTTRVVRLEDIDYAAFEKAMQYVEDSGRTLLIEQALIVGPIYDRLQFPFGLKMVRRVIRDYLEMPEERLVPSWISILGAVRFELTIRATLLAEQLHYEEGMIAGRKMLAVLLRPGPHTKHVSRLELKASHIDIAKPLIASYPDDLLPRGLRVSDISCRLFSDHVIMQMKIKMMEQAMASGSA
jgi:hypothetical protein